MPNRYDELTPAQQDFFDRYINAIASGGEEVDDWCRILGFSNIELKVTNALEFPIIVRNPSGPMGVLGISLLAERLEVPGGLIRRIVQEYIDAEG